MPSWVSYQALKDVAAVLGILAGIATAVGILHRQVISPWIAKPIAKGVKNELADYMEVILFSEPMVTQLREVVQEEVVKGNDAVMALLKEHERRLARMESKQNKIIKETVRRHDEDDEHEQPARH